MSRSTKQINPNDNYDLNKIRKKLLSEASTYKDPRYAKILTSAHALRTSKLKESVLLVHKNRGKSNAARKYKNKPRPHKCEVCGKAFSWKSHLNTHMNIHTGKRPFKCTHKSCGKSFTQSGALNTHMRLHRGEKSYTCMLCNKPFNEAGDLAKHIRTHTGEKPFVCTYCKRAFSQSGNLKRHLRIHTGEKPYYCSKCNSGFLVKGHLKSHRCPLKKRNSPYRKKQKEILSAITLHGVVAVAALVLKKREIGEKIDSKNYNNSDNKCNQNMDHDTNSNTNNIMTPAPTPAPKRET